jgi:hypothetical protein
MVIVKGGLIRKGEIKGIFLIGAFWAGIFVGFPQKAIGSQGFGYPTLRFTGTIFPADVKDIKGGLRYQKISIEHKE